MNVGDKVKLLKLFDYDISKGIKVGDVGIIKHIKSDILFVNIPELKWTLTIKKNDVILI